MYLSLSMLSLRRGRGVREIYSLKRNISPDLFYNRALISCLLEPFEEIGLSNNAVYTFLVKFVLLGKLASLNKFPR